MKNILIVDDSSVMRKIVERCLRQAGVEIKKVHEANDGYEGLSVVQQNNIDLILCDINMPTMDGLEFLQALRTAEQARNIPVVMITTEGSEDRVYEALSSGARGYIRKPFTPEQLKEQVAPILEG
jgi:two-component system, chemotaxis family, chemotaxis protein CheY